jgi:hypothetical protein
VQHDVLVVASKGILVYHNVTRYGKYYIHLVPCAYPAAVNWTANFMNLGSHLSASLIPTASTFHATGFLWCFVALAYLITLGYVNFFLYDQLTLQKPSLEAITTYSNSYRCLSNYKGLYN